LPHECTGNRIMFEEPHPIPWVPCWTVDYWRDWCFNKLLMAMTKILEKEIQVRAVDTDFQGKIRVDMFLNVLMEAASEHSAQMGVSVLELFKQNLTWVLSRWHIRILRYPERWNTFHVNTWPSLRQGMFSLREFEVFDEKGPLAQATTSWLALDLTSKRPVRMEQFLPDFELESRRALQDDFEPLPKLDKPGLENEYPVFRSYLDVNRHVTSTAYILWALETTPENILLKLRPSEIEINYRAETFYGDRILSRSQRLMESKRPTFLHTLLRAGDGKELAALRTVWSDL